MRTNDLIAILSTHVEPVERRRIVRVVGTAVAIGAVFVIGAVFGALGVRANVMQVDVLAVLFWKLLFTVLVLGLASIYLIKLARPGGERSTSISLIALPFIAVTVLAFITLLIRPSSHWNQMIVGEKWLECLLSIPIIAIVPFAVMIWAVRQMAPTDLVRTGALTGLVAGSLSATGYALHCADDSLPFVALWYGGTIALCTLAGAGLGPRFLRW